MERSGANRGTLTRFELAAVAYLVLPIGIFLAAYVKAQVSIPACVFLGFAFWRCVVRLEATPARQSAALCLYLWGIAGLTVFASGSFGIAPTNTDWIKHFSVFNFLVDNDSLIGNAPGYDGGTLRYYLAWYIIPGLLAKSLSVKALLPLVGAWSTIGLYLFFSVAATLTDRPNWRFAFPALFLLFSGADALGTAITGFIIASSDHIEWWSGWIEFSSTYTDVIWAPQHALSAWLGVALALRLSGNASALLVVPLTTSAMVLWSPFSAIGLVPFFLYLLWQQRRLVSIEVIISAIFMLAITILLGRYMRVATEDMPFKAVWNLRCLGQGPCYTFPAYLRFIALEVLPTIAICQVVTRGRDPMVWIASLSLLTMPFVQFGAYNDLNLHGSIPAIAVLAVTAWRVMPCASRFTRSMFAIVLLAGFPTPFMEIRRAFLLKDAPTPTMRFSYLLAAVPSIRNQYLIDKAPWIVRRPTAPRTVSE
jgi:hypothetical protein